MINLPQTSSIAARVTDQAFAEIPLLGGTRRLLTTTDYSGRSAISPRAWITQSDDTLQKLQDWCNCPLFNLGERFKDLRQATAVLGAQPVAQLALLAGFRTLFLPNLRFESYAREQLWRRSIAVGAVASLIARTCQRADPDSVFLAGSLIDVGLLASEKSQTDAFQYVVKSIQPDEDTLVTEQRLLGWDHATLGAGLLERWGAPEKVCEIVRYHHSPLDSEFCGDREQLHCVCLADYLCSRCGWTSLGLHNVPQPSDAMFRTLGIDADCLMILWQALYETLEQTRAMV
ncbi:HDOD domain protein [Roseimaritima multifibrata]|uniref:HDOD domain protein n=1 Tax=Roseimaritima multifibrata TaxID=1930274 RepID=A0A517MGP2_9BACT|nr:HDOD domain-containing protein [Roseimaritima multifibrata]QDS94062.1 HDOD domain protein [Roseimaritima multifibrata]